MELLFESRTNLAGFRGHLNFVQHAPTIHPEPVLGPDTFTDGKGLSIYGTVLWDGGRLRMWYLAMPEDWDYAGDMSCTAYAESDDGIHWTRPALGAIEHGPGPNNLVNISLHCPSVWIDPDGAPESRYRATGCGYPGLFMGHPDIRIGGYYTSHSADGIDWRLDSDAPTWPGGDVITSIYHPWQRRAIVAMKQTPRVNRIGRRSIHAAEFRGGAYSPAVSALYPDEFDDVCAVQRGHTSCDYYGMGMQAAGSGTVGFLWNYWHDLPYTGDRRVALYGVSDITLVYQPEPGGRWFHVPGRPDFINHRAIPSWMRGWINTASCPVEMGDEHWLYFSSCAATHGFYLDENWKPIERWTEWTTRHGRGVIGFARWPKWRLFGFESDPEGELVIDLGPTDRPSELFLNYTTCADGAVRAELLDAPARTLAESVPLTGQSTAAPVAWKDGALLAASPDRNVRVRLHLAMATVYAYELRLKTC